MNLTNHDKAQIDKIKPNTKIRILSEEHRKYVSQLFETVNPSDLKIFEHVDYLCFVSLNKKSPIEWTYVSSDKGFNNHANEEIFIDLPPKEPKIADLSLSLGVEIEQLPEKFYIDCGDRIEVREWLDGMGFKWGSGKSLILNGLDESIIYVNKSMSHCYIGVRFTENYTLIKPKLTVTSFEVERTQSNENERSKEIEELKRLHNEIGERLDALLSINK